MKLSCREWFECMGAVTSSQPTFSTEAGSSGITRCIEPSISLSVGFTSSASNSIAVNFASCKLSANPPGSAAVLIANVSEGPSVHVAILGAKCQKKPLSEG